MATVDIVDDVKWVGAFWQRVRSIDEDAIHNILPIGEWDAWRYFWNTMADVMETFYEHSKNGKDSPDWDKRWQKKSMTSAKLAQNIAALNQTLSDNKAYMQKLATLNRTMSRLSPTMQTLKDLWTMYETRKTRLETERVWEISRRQLLAAELSRERERETPQQRYERGDKMRSNTGNRNNMELLLNRLQCINNCAT